MTEKLYAPTVEERRLLAVVFVLLVVEAVVVVVDARTGALLATHGHDITIHVGAGRIQSTRERSEWNICSQSHCARGYIYGYDRLA